VAIDLDDQRGQADHRCPDSLITKGTSINDVRFDLARGAAGFAYTRILSGGGSGISWWICPPATRCGGWRTIPPCCRPGFPRDREGKPFVIQGDGRRRAFTGIGRGRRHRGFGGRQAVYYCPIASRNLYSVDAAVLTDSPNPTRRGRDGQEPGDKGEWVAEADAQGRVYLTNGEFTPSCGSIRRRERRHFQPDV